MEPIVNYLMSWHFLVTAIVVFGFAPGAALRLIVLAFPRNDPRRRELLAELHSVPRVERPFWVAEQLEVALCEGVAGRLRRGFRQGSAWFLGRPRRSFFSFAFEPVTVGLAAMTQGYNIPVIPTALAAIDCLAIWVVVAVTFGSERRENCYLSWGLLTVAAGLGIAASGLSVTLGAAYMIIGILPMGHYYGHSRHMRKLRVPTRG